MKQRIISGTGIALIVLAAIWLAFSRPRAAAVSPAPAAAAQITPTVDHFLPHVARQPTLTPTPTITPSPTPTPTNTPTPLPSQSLKVCRVPDTGIPDDDPGGLDDTITSSVSGPIVDLDISLVITHSWVGDLIVKLTRTDPGSGSTLTATLIDRPGFPASVLGCGGNNLFATLDDEASVLAEDQCGSNPAISGRVQPNQPLSLFDTTNLAANWTLNVSDNVGGDVGTFVGWCMLVEYQP